MQEWLSNTAVLLCFILPGKNLWCQTHRTDRELLSKQNFYEAKFETKPHVSFMFVPKKNPLARYNPFSLTLGGLMYMYQKFFSQQIFANCPYQPSCSYFSRQAIQRYGLLPGIALSADRLTRCNRIAAADISALDIQHNKIQDPPEKYCIRK